MAHAIDRLALLYPYPDAVRGFALHKTLTSSRLTARSQPYDEPRGTISLAVADCKYRAPLSPRSAQCNHFNLNFKKKQGNIAARKIFLIFNTEKMSKNFCRQIADNRYLKKLNRDCPENSLLYLIFLLLYRSTFRNITYARGVRTRKTKENKNTDK